MSSIHRSVNSPMEFERTYWKEMNRVPRRFVGTKMVLKHGSKRKSLDETFADNCFYMTPLIFFITFAIAGIFLGTSSDIQCITSKEGSQWSYVLDDLCRSQIPQGCMNAEYNTNASMCYGRVHSWFYEDNLDVFLVFCLETVLFTISSLCLRVFNSINKKNLEEDQLEGRVILQTSHSNPADKIKIPRIHVSSYYIKSIIKYLGLRAIAEILCCATIIGHIILLRGCVVRDGFKIWNPVFTNGRLAVLPDNFKCNLNSTFVGNAGAEIMCLLPKNMVKNVVSINLWYCLSALMIVYIIQLIITIGSIIGLLLTKKEKKIIRYLKL